MVKKKVSFLSPKSLNRGFVTRKLQQNDEDKKFHVCRDGGFGFDV
jgi:hypothetical protein